MSEDGRFLRFHMGEDASSDKPCVVLCMGLTFPPAITAYGPFDNLDDAQDWWERTRDFHNTEGSMHAICSLDEPVVPQFGGQPLPKRPENN
jgi:hypothetical protein